MIHDDPRGGELIETSDALLRAFLPYLTHRCGWRPDSVPPLCGRCYQAPLGLDSTWASRGDEVEHRSSWRLRLASGRRNQHEALPLTHRPRSRAAALIRWPRVSVRELASHERLREPPSSLRNPRSAAGRRTRRRASSAPRLPRKRIDRAPARRTSAAGAESATR